MKQLFLAGILICISISTFAQDNKDSSKEDNTFNQMLDYSRPGKYHQLLEELVGNWKFEGSRLEWIDSVTSKEVMKLAGSLTRKSFADGRFFIAEITTAAKIQLPVKDGKMITDYAKAIQLEGYDNVKKKFQLSYINNHIGSDITFWQGTYDSTTRTISFYSSIADIPGQEINIRFDFVFNDKNHYQWNYYSEQNGKYIKDTEMNFRRVQ